MGALLGLTAAFTSGVAALVPAAHADDDFGVALNGVYRVMSDGDWAKGNEVKYKQQTVIETWTVTTDCVSPIECTGTVVSDRGWTATARLDDYWVIDHDIPNWVPCPDGTFAPGHQKFMVMGWNRQTELRDTHETNFLVGRNVTKSPSGACGVNKPVVIEMPVWMEKIG